MITELRVTTPVHEESEEPLSDFECVIRFLQAYCLFFLLKMARKLSRIADMSRGKRSKLFR